MYVAIALHMQEQKSVKNKKIKLSQTHIFIKIYIKKKLEYIFLVASTEPFHDSSNKKMALLYMNYNLNPLSCDCFRDKWIKIEIMYVFLRDFSATALMQDEHILCPIYEASPIYEQQYCLS